MILAVAQWAAAVLAGVLPKPLWHRFQSLHMESAAGASGLLTAALGFFAGVRGFLSFAEGATSTENSWMLRQLGTPSPHVNPYAVAIVPYGTSMFLPFEFFFTPFGLFTAYLTVSGLIRAASAWFGDPRGDFILAGIAAVVTRVSRSASTRSARLARERLEGADARDVLRRGAWCGVDADYVVLSARRKAEWTEGAIILTRTDWFRLGVPFDMDTPSGLRTAYPLKKMETVEVVRRGIEYELPRLP